jgi:hypothetical protein
MANPANFLRFYSLMGEMMRLRCGGGVVDSGFARGYDSRISKLSFDEKFCYCVALLKSVSEGGVDSMACAAGRGRICNQTVAKLPYRTQPPAKLSGELVSE